MATAHHRRQPTQRRRRGSGYPAQDLRQRALAWAVKLRVNPRVIRVQDMRHKWGSCTSHGTVTLAHDLVDRPDEFQDYVIVHELLHLRYHSHGRVFKALMSAYVPGWQAMETRRSR
jgi:predicted metal-dependent hydrolase